ncbi:MAG TPA: phosphoribosylglycinamide formyltransferase [Myxococcales bacterium]|nr:phosphoribosylglycinamide formyltransferase [Myxococcales bacterium]
MFTLVILISGRGSNMQAILESLPRLPHVRVAAVISNRPDAAGLNTAQNAHIPTQVVDHTHYTARDDFDQALQQRIDEWQPNLVVLAGFMRILSREFVQHYAQRLINIHPSLLPAYKGLNTHQRVLDAGESRHGASVHFVTPELDDGPVILQAEVPVYSDDTAKNLAQRVLVEEHRLYPQAIRQLAARHKASS